MTLEKAFATLLSEIKEQLRAELLEEFKSAPSKVHDRQIDIKEASELTGFSVETLYRMCTQKQIPHIRGGAIGSRKPAITFSTASIDAWKREQERLNYQPQMKGGERVVQ